MDRSNDVNLTIFAKQMLRLNILYRANLKIFYKIKLHRISFDLRGKIMPINISQNVIKIMNFMSGNRIVLIIK